MAELTAVGWLVSPTIKVLVDKARSYIEGQYNWHKDTKEDLRKLESTLIQLQTVVAAAERRQTKDDSQDTLLRQLKDGVYEADDLLDEFEYRIMQSRAEKAKGMVSRATSSSVKLAKRLVGRDKLRTKLTDLLKKLDDVNKSADRFIQVEGLEKRNSGGQNNIKPNRVTGSILPAIEIFGRDKEKDETINLLLKIPNKPESSYTNISVIAIVGDGGVGKTTLAQLIYNDKIVVDHFDTRMWVRVSENFDDIKLTRDILESASQGKERYMDINNFDVLQRELQTELEFKRFLLVLDDVWIEKGEVLDQEMWKKVLAPLKYSGRGSMILMTTRMKIVAEMFSGETKLVPLKGLSDGENWSLLKKIAFSNENPKNYPHLQQIGMQIVKRLNGSPLAAKIVGAMLKDRLDDKKWIEILKTNMFNDVMSILRLSYQRLPDYLKHCFAYCSIFPKNWHFYSEKLVLLWIAQDYIQVPLRNERSILDIGIDYFNELLSRSFFQKVDQYSHVYYVIHDLIHDLAQFISMDECYRIDVGKHKSIMQPIRHLGITINGIDEIRDFVAQLENGSNLRNLRTLIFFVNGWWINSKDLPLCMFKELKSLRVLDFGGLCTGNLPKSIGDLTHLRYLNLGRDWFQILPNSFCELYHLQVLAACGMQSFCKSMSKLIKFGELARLHVPAFKFHVEKKRGHRIGVLKEMNVVLPGKLCIENLENVNGRKEAVEVELRFKQHIDGLVLGWGNSKKTRSSEVDEEVLEALQPHPNLKELEIEGFRGTRWPRWLETNWLRNVKVICLFYCGCLEVLPPLGHLPLLKELKIGGMHAVRRVGSGFYGNNDNDGLKGFPCLEVLVFQNMLEWSEWSDVEFPVFPRLRRLRVWRCPRLMWLPLFPPTLREIEIHDTGLISRLYLRPSSSSECFVLESSIIPSRVLPHDHLLGAITELKIRDCKEPMLAGGILELTVLKKLQISCCPEQSVSRIVDEEDGTGGVLPSSLKSLEINECHVTDKWLSRCMQGLASLSKLKIQFCTGLTSLPLALVLHHLTALRKLKISFCEDLRSLGGLHALNSLRRLEVAHCPKLKSLPEEGLPASIEYLLLQDCDSALEQQIREKKGPDWDKIAYIPRVYWIVD